jgi:hypothetical protein
MNSTTMFSHNCIGLNWSTGKPVLGMVPPYLATKSEPDTGQD